MIISHNLAAMNTNRMLNINDSKKAKTMEKLSSGYRINRSADDAAGLAISEKMRRQIRGLSQASFNSQDGISLVQVADGALNETHEVLQRMNELAVKAANGTNTDTDCEYIQAEIDQLTKELDRIATETSFNEGIYPLNCGDVLPSTVGERPITVVNNGTSTITCDGVTYQPGESFIIDNVLTIFQENNSNIHYSSAIFTHKTGGTSGSGYFMPTIDNQMKPYEVDGFGVPHTTIYQTLDDLRVDENGYLYAMNLTNTGGRYYLGETQFTSVTNPSDITEMENKKIQKVLGVPQELAIQAGSEAGEHIAIPLVNATAKKLGVKPLNVSTSDIADRAIPKIKRAIEKVSQFRSDFGAVQNRLEHTIANLDNAVENTQSAESVIRDADMAKEMFSLSTMSILSQASQSMLAQANQQGQGVLSLLQ